MIAFRTNSDSIFQNQEEKIIILTEMFDIHEARNNKPKDNQTFLSFHVRALDVFIMRFLSS